MALPKIDLPLYTTEIPTTGKTVSYRPFLVKEEKILLMALESGEEENIHNATLQIIQNCVPEVDIDKLASFDTEWLFLQIRRRSIGEKTTLRFRHKDGMNSKGVQCKAVMSVEVDLAEVEMLGQIKPPVIQLTDDIGMKMRYPTIKETIDISKEGGGKVERTLHTIAKCIDVIFDGDDIFPAKNSSEEELLEFLDNLNSEQFQLIQKFISEIPKLHKTVKHKCETCQDVIVHEVEGLSSFFG